MLDYLIIIFSLILANIPWFSSSFLLVIPRKTKTIGLICIELLIIYVVLGLILIAIENQVIGNVHSQDWEFYVVTFFLFVVFSFPGFIFKVIWK